MNYLIYMFPKVGKKIYPIWFDSNIIQNLKQKDKLRKKDKQEIFRQKRALLNSGQKLNTILNGLIIIMSREYSETLVLTLESFVLILILKMV